MPTPLPERPTLSADIVKQAVHTVCRKINPDKGVFLAESVLEVYDPLFCHGGQELSDLITRYGWNLTSEEGQVLNEIYPLTHALLREKEIEWAKSNKDALMRMLLQVGDRLPQGVITSAHMTDDETLPIASYRVEPDVDPVTGKKPSFWYTVLIEEAALS